MEKLSNTQNEIIKYYKELFQKAKTDLAIKYKALTEEEREKAFEYLKNNGFPTKKNEEWKYTDTKRLIKERFEFIPNNSEEFVTEIKGKYITQNINSNFLVFINGIFTEKLSYIKANDKEKLTINNINSLGEKEKEKIFKHFKTEMIEDGFDALNKAFANDGVFIELSSNTILEEPIKIIFINGTYNKNVISSPKNIFLLGKNSSAKIITKYYGTEDNLYFNNSNTSIFIDENGHLDYYKIQYENENSFHIDRITVEQKSHSTFSAHTFSVGGGNITRNQVSSILMGENIDCNLHGLSLGNKKRLIDNHTFINHAKPNSRSREVYKNVLADNSHGVFSGKVLVKQEAQKTDAYQSNKTILLSKDASVDTKPQLEIFADDVKCSHGATVGNLDKKALFYLRTRGINRKLANSILIGGFVDDVIKEIKIPELLEEIKENVSNKLQKIERVNE